MKTLVLLVLLLVPIETSATVLFAIRSEDEVVLCADTKMVTGSGRAFSGCKIISGGDIFCGLAGELTWPEVGFDGMDFAKQLMFRPNQSAFWPRVFEFQSAMTYMVNIKVEQQRVNRTNQYQQWVRAGVGHVLLQTLFVGRDDSGVPVMASLEFVLADTINSVPVIVRTEAFGKGRTGVIPLGTHNQIDQFATKPVAGPLTERAKEWARLQIEATPDYTGGPVDILRITSRNAEWLTPREGCPATF